MRTIAQLAQEAIEVQDTCNPLGVSKGFAEALQDLREALTLAKQPDDTPAMCNHPIARLWASKIYDLHRMGLSDLGKFIQAYNECQELAGNIKTEQTVSN